MEIKVVKWKGADIAEVTGDDKSIRNSQTIQDLFEEVHSKRELDRMLVDRKLIDESFFDPGSGFADELIKRFTEQLMKLAVTGNIPLLQSLALKAFLLERKLGKAVRLVPDREKTLDWLSQA